MSDLASPVQSDTLTVALDSEAIVIRLPLSVLPAALEGAWAASGIDLHFRVTDVGKFAPEVVRALEEEEEDGTTPVHRLFDAAFNAAIEQGAEGVEEVDENDVDEPGDVS